MTDVLDRPTRVYRYRQLSTDKHVGYLVASIVKGEFFANTPATFNDPFDCCPSITMEATEGELVANFCRVNVNTFPDQMQRVAEGVMWARAVLAGDPQTLAHHKKATETFQHNLMNTWGAVSLAERWDCELMWGHYANCHTGACLELDTSHIGQDLSFGQVVYTKDRVPLNMVTGDRDIPRMIEATMLTKSSVWSYEKEWRILRAPGAFKMPIPCISSVIIGARANRQYSDNLVAAVRAERPDLPIYWAKLSDKRFEVEKTSTPPW